MTSQYSAALNFYLQAGAVCSDFFTKPVPPDAYTDQVNPTCSFRPLAKRKMKRSASVKNVCCLQVLKRMIKCCSMMNCHTQVSLKWTAHVEASEIQSLTSMSLELLFFFLQVAVLCQFLREVDYMTAFKALQEQNRWDPEETTCYHQNQPSNSALLHLHSHDAMDSFYDYIWDVTILEYLTRILS